jgi:hypothetical protein
LRPERGPTLHCCCPSHFPSSPTEGVPKRRWSNLLIYIILCVFPIDEPSDWAIQGFQLGFSTRIGSRGPEEMRRRMFRRDLQYSYLSNLQVKYGNHGKGQKIGP